MDAISTSENSPIEFIAAGFWLRAGAFMIDSFILWIPLIPFLILFKSTRSSSQSVVFLGGGVYATLLPAFMNGQTLGKKLACIRIVRLNGSPLSFGRAFLRWIGVNVSLISMGLGFLLALFTHQKRALHDFVAGTRVVRIQILSSPRKIVVYGAAFLFPGIAILGIVAAIMIPILQRGLHRSLSQNVQTKTQN